MKVVVARGALESTAALDELDTLAQVDAVTAALHRLGYEVEQVVIGLDLDAASAALRAARPDLVFNLVEAIGGSSRMHPIAATLFETLGLTYTGSGADGLYTSANKRLAKRMLMTAGQPTPSWLTCDESCGAPWDGPWIVKSVWDHASIGITDASVVADVQAARARIAMLGRADWFAERYVDGRELTLAWLALDDGVELLPTTEIDFTGFAPERPRILGYAAKWDTTAADYTHTPRRFVDATREAELLAELAELTHAVRELFDLGSYGRIDVRLDAAGHPWIVDINANPCITSDAGFVAQAAQAGIEYTDLVRRILAAY